MEQLRARFYQGMRDLHGIGDEVADRIYEKLYAFANFGFPESHSQSFAALVFYSSWFKLHHPRCVLRRTSARAAHGFLLAAVLVADARRHGVQVHGADINVSLAHATVEAGGFEVRLGLGEVRNIGDALAEKIVEQRDLGGPFTSFLDLTGRVELTTAQAESLGDRRCASQLRYLA